MPRQVAASQTILRGSLDNVVLNHFHIRDQIRCHRRNWQERSQFDHKLWFTMHSTFAYTFIRIRAFHNAISRSCVLFNTSRRRQRWWINFFALAHEQADRLTTRQGTREEKKRNWKSEKKKAWVQLVCNWEYRRRLRPSKRFFEIWCTCHQMDLAVRYKIPACHLS